MRKPKAKMVNGELHVRRVDGAKIVFSTIESRERRRKAKPKLPNYYGKYKE